MAKLYRDYGFSLLLLIASGLLAVVLLLEWAHFRGEQADLKRRLAAKVEVNLGTIEGKEETYGLPGIEEYSEMIDRPLFVDGRRPPEIEERPGEASVEQTPLTLKLMGVVFTPKDKSALFVDAQGKYKRARMNTVISGWRLVEIEKDKVILTQGAERRELLLLKAKPKTAMPAQTGQPVVRKQKVLAGDEPDESDSTDQSENSADENPEPDEPTDEEQ